MSQHIKWTMLKDELGFHIYQEPLTDESYPICVVGTRAPNREKSALLITAAPDLLAALKVCLRNCEARLYMLPVDASEQKDILSCEIGNIKAAIRRAEEGG